MQKEMPQRPEVLVEVARLKDFFETTPILIKEWKEGAMVVKDIAEFIKLELHAATHFNPKYPFNPPLKRLLQLEVAIRNQLTSLPERGDEGS